MSQNAIDRLISNWGGRTSSSNPSLVMLDKSIIERLASIAFGRHVFDESAYLETHPDIGRAVVNGSFLSGLQHYIWDGIREGRAIPETPVDADKYAAANPDLTKAADMDEASLKAHWSNIGWIEGRRTE
ncbi:hypothetical protein [Phreatobacter oligotrophus]|uniref:Uncharacterized protein n=1 Tax=Phreatobacter oligotrophus TaxID=1122261 RepID=A0A2T4YP57_9HYPH|nr:hypothetical protein [Phreatobacter oligotrophus]PTM45279.1 hypothetical protein C8P69_1322 [Phreatobacter oligotrophus]